MDTINQPVQSNAGKLSWSNMALKRCTSTEHIWNRKLVSLTSPVCSEIFLPRSHRSWRADVLSTPSVSMAIGSKIYRPSRSAYFSSLRETAVSIITISIIIKEWRSDGWRKWKLWYITKQNLQNGVDVVFSLVDNGSNASFDNQTISLVDRYE